MKKLLIFLGLILTIFICGCSNAKGNITNISFTEDKKEIIVGNEDFLPIIIEGKGTFDEVTYEFSEEGIVSIDQDVITALKTGTVIVTARAKYNKEIFSEIEIVVVTNEPKEFVNLFVPTTSIRIGDKISFDILNMDDLKVSSKSDFIWQSSDESIAKFNDNYELEGIRQGKVTVTVTQKNKPQNSNTRPISVGYPSDLKTENNEPNSGPLILYTESGEFTIEAGVETQLKVFEAQNYLRYYWSSSDEDILCVSETGEMIGCREGVVTVTVVSKDADPGTNNSVTIHVTGKSKLNYIERLLTIALAEQGEKEATGNNDSKFNEWAHCYDAWCAIFVSWCANQAGIPRSILNRSISVTVLYNSFVSKNQFHYKEDYIPVAGDIIIFKSDGASHVGIVVTCDGKTVYTIEGNTSNMVARRSYDLNDSKITGYGHPNYGEYSKDTGVKWE